MPTDRTEPEYYWANYTGTYHTAHLIDVNGTRRVDRGIGELAACGQYLYAYAINRNEWTHQACKRCKRTHAHRAIMEGRA